MMSTLRQKKPITIVLFGRTGAGKSSLANKLIGRVHFTEGHSLTSQTDVVTSETFTWPLDPSIQVIIIDTPGFADNRPEMTNGQLLSRILDFLKNLQDGLHIAVFCLSVNTRIDGHDTQELEMLSLLLGRDLFEHTCIAVTQINQRHPDQRQRICENYIQELPRIFMQNGLPPFTEDRILLADFNQLESSFLQPMTELIRTTTSYVPKLAEEIDPQDPSSIERFLAKPEIKEMMAHYEKRAEEQKKQIEEMKELTEKQAEDIRIQTATFQQKLQVSEESLKKVNQQLQAQQAQNEKARQDYEENQKQERKKMDALSGKIDSLTSENNASQRQLLSYQETINKANRQFEDQQAKTEKMKQYYEDYRKQEEKKVEALTGKIDSLSSYSNNNQQQLDKYQGQIKVLNKKLKQFKQVRSPQPQVVYRDRERGGFCNIF